MKHTEAIQEFLDLYNPVKNELDHYKLVYVPRERMWRLARALQTTEVEVANMIARQASVTVRRSAADGLWQFMGRS